MTEKQIIEDFASRFSGGYGPYRLARKIHERSFCLDDNLSLAYQVKRSYYSVLSVIRRYRAKQQRPQPMYS